MASIYAGLKGQIPEEPTEREAALQVKLGEWQDESIATLTNLYNANRIGREALAEKTRENKIHGDALEILIRSRLDTIGGGVQGLNGFTWSETFEPYPIADDPGAIIQYFEEHEMQDQLVLKASELASRLKAFVKEEALANELVIETKTVKDDLTGEEREVTEVRSRIPGVRVFLKGGLSRTKSKGA